VIFVIDITTPDGKVGSTPETLGCCLSERQLRH